MTAVRSFSSFISKHKSTILTIGSIIGTCTTAILSFRAGVKAEQIMQKNEFITKKELVKEMLPSAIPPVVSMIGTVSCCIGANSVSLNREAALTQTLERHIDKLDKAKIALSAAAGSAMSEQVVSQIIGKPTIVAKEKSLWYEVYTETWFEATYEEVLEAEYSLNRIMALRTYVRFDEWLTLLGIIKSKNEEKEYEDTRYIGWCFENGVDDGYLWVDFAHRAKTTEDGTEYTIIEYPFWPRYLYTDE